VKAIEVSYSQGYGQDWLGEEVAQSTTRVRSLRSLRVYLHTAILDTRMVTQIVTALPSLESLWLPVFDYVSGPFARLPWRLISFRHSSLHSSATSGNHFSTPKRGIAPFVHKTPSRGQPRAFPRPALSQMRRARLARLAQPCIGLGAFNHARSVPHRAPGVRVSCDAQHHRPSCNFLEIISQFLVLYRENIVK
jgi:hypothetical protein